MVQMPLLLQSQTDPIGQTQYTVTNNTTEELDIWSGADPTSTSTTSILKSFTKTLTHPALAVSSADPSESYEDVIDNEYSVTLGTASDPSVPAIVAMVSGNPGPSTNQTSRTVQFTLSNIESTSQTKAYKVVIDNNPLLIY